MMTSQHSGGVWLKDILSQIYPGQYLGKVREFQHNGLFEVSNRVCSQGPVAPPPQSGLG